MYVNNRGFLKPRSTSCTTFMCSLANDIIINTGIQNLKLQSSLTLALSFIPYHPINLLIPFNFVKQWQEFMLSNIQ